MKTVKEDINDTVCLISFFEDDTYLQSCTDGGWAYIDNRFPEKRIIKRVQ